MELQENTVTFEISGAPLEQEKLNKSQRVLHKCVQFEDAISAEENPRIIYINDPRRTNDKYEFTGNEIQTTIKDGYEDLRRHRSDRKENNREAQVLLSGRFMMKKWKQIRAGEVVKISADETMPCDMVLLGTSDPNGIAYIQTMNLDGESNLKTRYARQETVSATFEGVAISGVIRCEQPNRNIYEFTGNMEFNGRRVPLSQSNIVLHGCQLKNTDWLVGVVVYAGQETKPMLNSAVTPPKRSRLETYMNRETLWLSVFLCHVCNSGSRYGTVAPSPWGLA